MENDQMDPQQMSNKVPNQQPMEDGKQVGPVIGAVIIVAVLVIGGLYYWGAELDKQTAVDENLTGEQIAAEEDIATQALSEQGTSDEVSAIEDDLNLTDLDDLDAELGNIDAELNF